MINPQCLLFVMFVFIFCYFFLYVLAMVCEHSDRRESGEDYKAALPFLTRRKGNRGGQR